MIGSIELPWWYIVIYFLQGVIITISVYLLCFLLWMLVKEPDKLKEALARIWPFGEWDVVFLREDGEGQRHIPSIKEKTVEYYFRYIESDIIEDAWITKVGGFFDGIRYKPRKGRRWGTKQS